MPTYEYECPKCGHVFECQQVKMGDKAPWECSQCGHAKAARKLSTFATGRSQTGAGACSPRRG